MENRKDDNYFVDKIVNCINTIEEVSKNKSMEDIENDVMVNNTIMFQFTLIGEYSTRLTEEYKNSKPNVPWQEIMGFRNRIVHDYNGVVYSRISRTIESDLPILKKEILRWNTT